MNLIVNAHGILHLNSFNITHKIWFNPRMFSIQPAYIAFFLNVWANLSLSDLIKKAFMKQKSVLLQTLKGIGGNLI